MSDSIEKTAKEHSETESVHEFAAKNLLAEVNASQTEQKSGGQIQSPLRIYVQPHVLENLAKLHPEKAEHYREMLRPPEMTGRLSPHSAGEDTDGRREVYDAKGVLGLPGELVRKEGEGPSGNKSVDQVYDLTGVVRDFYRVNYNRNSIDDQGMPMVSTVNYADRPGQPMLNAFWNGRQMAYGAPDKDDPIATFLLLDIAGHEITHGVSQLEANLGGWGQAGSLNESDSDVFGEQIKQWQAGLTSDKGHWIGAEGFWKPGPGNRRGLRDLANPGNAFDAPDIGKDDAPSKMSQYNITAEDCGGVHANSQIPTAAFAHFAIELAKEHPNDDEKRFSFNEPGHIWYEARRAAGANPSFAEMAFQTIKAASNNPKFRADVPLLEKAWRDVGVTPSENAPDELTPPNPGDPRCG